MSIVYESGKSRFQNINQSFENKSTLYSQPWTRKKKLFPDEAVYVDPKAVSKGLPIELLDVKNGKLADLVIESIKRQLLDLKTGKQISRIRFFYNEIINENEQPIYGNIKPSNYENEIEVFENKLDKLDTENTLSGIIRDNFNGINYQKKYRLPDMFDNGSDINKQQIKDLLVSTLKESLSQSIESGYSSGESFGGSRKINKKRKTNKSYKQHNSRKHNSRKQNSRKQKTKLSKLSKHKKTRKHK